MKTIPSASQRGKLGVLTQEADQDVHACIGSPWRWQVWALVEIGCNAFAF